MTDQTPQGARFALTLFLFILTGTASVVAQGIATDRPGFTASAIVVPRGSFQLESGATFESSSNSDGAGVDQLILGEALIRFGSLERLELRAELPNYNSLSFSDDIDIPSVDGFGDSRLGIKYQIGPLDEGASFDLAFLGMISVPTGSEAFTSDEVDPEVILATNKVLGSNLSLGGQITGSLPATDEGRVFEWGLTLASSTSIGSVGLFFEFDIDIPDQGDAPMMVHTGFVLPIGPRFQLDVHGALGVSDTAPDSFIEAGFAVVI